MLVHSNVKSVSRKRLTVSLVSNQELTPQLAAAHQASTKTLLMSVKNATPNV